MGPGLPGPKIFKRPNLAISSFKKGKIFKNKKGKKGQIFKENLLKQEKQILEFYKICMVSFAQIFPKEALKGTISFNFQKGKKLAK